MYLIGQQRDIKNISFFSRDSWNVSSLFQSIIMDPFNSAIEVMSYRTVYRHHHFPPLFRSESLTYNLSLPFFIFSTLNSLSLSPSLSLSLSLSLSPSLSLFLSLSLSHYFTFLPLLGIRNSLDPSARRDEEDLWNVDFDFSAQPSRNINPRQLEQREQDEEQQQKQQKQRKQSIKKK